MTDRSRSIGALSAVLGVLVAAPLFYPLLRATGTGGGDVSMPLRVDVTLGLLGGLGVIPIAAVIGYLVGVRIGDRPVDSALGLRLVLLGVVTALALPALLGGWKEPASLMVVGLLGAVTALIAIWARRQLAVVLPDAVRSGPVAGG